MENALFLQRIGLALCFLALASPVWGQPAADVSDSLVVEYRSAMAQAWKYSDLRNSTSGEDSLVIVYELERGG